MLALWVPVFHIFIDNLEALFLLFNSKASKLLSETFICTHSICGFILLYPVYRKF